MSRVAVLVMLLALVAPAGVRLAEAQQAPPSRPSRPYRGLFGSGPGDTSQSLVLSGALGAGYFGTLGDVPAATPDPDNPDASVRARNSSYGNANGALSYSLGLSRLTLGASVSTSGRYYQRRGAFLLGGRNLSGNVDYRFSDRTAMSASHQLRISPYNVVGIFPNLFDPTAGGQSTLIDEDALFGAGRYRANDTVADFTHQLTRRINMRLGYLHRTSSIAGGHNLVIDGGNFGFSIAMAKGLGIRLGYDHTEGEYGSTDGPQPFTSRTIDAGIDYNKALSFSRQTRLSFSTGSSGVTDRQRTRYIVTGDVVLSHEIGRSWTASLSYSRDVSFLQTLQDPTVANSLSAGVAGLINRRVSLRGSVGVARGDVGLTGGGSDVQAARATIGVGMALTRFLSINGSYAYYRHSFESGVVLPGGVTTRLDRQSVQVNLNAWIPIFASTRRPDAAR